MVEWLVVWIYTDVCMGDGWVVGICGYGWVWMGRVGTGGYGWVGVAKVGLG